LRLASVIIRFKYFEAFNIQNCFYNSESLKQKSLSYKIRNEFQI
jgi:sulfur relay (sulfurtransferase) DsrF/TusC family protein